MVFEGVEMANDQDCINFETTDAPIVLMRLLLSI